MLHLRTKGHFFLGPFISFLGTTMRIEQLLKPEPKKREQNEMGLGRHEFMMIVMARVLG